MRMAKLNFKNQGLRDLIELSEQATEFRIPNERGTTNSPSLWFVKDHGIYIMVAAVLEDKSLYKTQGTLYAVGYTPGQSEEGDLFEKTQAAVGGDDFIIPFDISDSLKEAINNGENLVIDFKDHDNITIQSIKP